MENSLRTLVVIHAVVAILTQTKILAPVWRSRVRLPPHLVLVHTACCIKEAILDNTAGRKHEPQLSMLLNSKADLVELGLRHVARHHVAFAAVAETVLACGATISRLTLTFRIVRADALIAGNATVHALAAHHHQVLLLPVALWKVLQRHRRWWHRCLLLLAWRTLREVVGLLFAFALEMPHWRLLPLLRIVSVPL